MSFKTTLSEIRSHNNKKEFYKRLKAWQIANNTTGCPYASELNLERIAYSTGRYGVNGTLYRDLTTGELIGVPETGNNIYIH